MNESRNLTSSYQLGTPQGLINFYLEQLTMMKIQGIGGYTSCRNKITERMVKMTVERLKELSVRHRIIFII